MKIKLRGKNEKLKRILGIKNLYETNFRNIYHYNLTLLNKFCNKLKKAEKSRKY